MSHKDNADLRNTGEGGWCYTEHELFSVFLPLIKADGGMVYMAMCRLIPLAAVRAEFPVTVDAVCEESCVSRGTTGRKMRDIIALGMVEETKHGSRRPSTYKLVPLRKLALLGVDELRRRLGVPPGDTDAEPVDDTPLTGRAARAARRRTGGGASAHLENRNLGEGSKAPGASGESGVPRWDTEPRNADGDEGAESVSQNRALVSHKTGLVSQNPASVSHQKTPFKQEEEEELENRKTPPTPVPGDGGGELILPIDNCTPDSAEFPASIAIAAHWVMQKLGLSKRRLQDTIGSALVQWCRREDKSLQDAAQLAVANYTRYMADVPLLRWGPWGPARFFAEGYWANPSAWPYDQAKQRASSEASAGVLGHADPGELERRHRMAIVGYLKLVMVRIERVGGFQPAMERLEALRVKVDQLGPEAIEKVLTDLELEMCEQVHAEATEDELVAVRAELEKKFAPYKGRMTDAQIGKEISGRIAVELLYKRGLPRLSLFFMDSP